MRMIVRGRVGAVPGHPKAVPTNVEIFSCYVPMPPKCIPLRCRIYLLLALMIQN